MFDFAFPAAALAQRCNDLASWEGIFGLQKLMDDVSDRFLPGPAVKALATSRPLKNFALQVMDDDIGQVQDFHERVEFGAHGRSPLLRAVLHVQFSHRPALDQAAKSPRRPLSGLSAIIIHRAFARTASSDMAP